MSVTLHTLSVTLHTWIVTFAHLFVMSSLNLKDTPRCCVKIGHKCATNVTCRRLFSTCARAMLVLINLTFLAAGWTLVALGLWLHVNQDANVYSHILKTYHSGRYPSTPPQRPLLTFDNFPYLLIVTGCFLAVTSFLGCCGACAESICFLSFHTLLTTVGIATEIITASMSSKLIEQVNHRLLMNMHNQVRTGYNGTVSDKKNNNNNNNNNNLSNDKLTQAWNYMQIQLQCCGADGPIDFLQSSWFNKTREWDGVFVPVSCCQLIEVEPITPVDKDLCQAEAVLFNKTIQPITQLNSHGCHVALRRWMGTYEYLIVTTLCILISTQVISLIFSCYLMTRVKKKHSEYSWCENDDCE